LREAKNKELEKDFNKTIIIQKTSLVRDAFIMCKSPQKAAYSPKAAFPFCISFKFEEN